MSSLVNKMERKLGRFAIPNLINYFIMVYAISTIVGLFVPGFYANFLSLDFRAIASGQVWRIITFVAEPASLSGMFGILVFILTVYIYHLFGQSLEKAWGPFRFNLFMFSGIILTVLGELVLYLTTGSYIYLGGMSFMYQSMFFAFCLLVPDQTFYLYFLIPLKAKWLAIFDGCLLAYNMFDYLRYGIVGLRYGFMPYLIYLGYVVAILMAALNFVLFLFAYKNLSRYSPKEVHRRKEFKRAVNMNPRITKHKCAICGRTDESNPELSFRFCSKCNGNYEYCQDHLFTHTHVGGGQK